MLVHKERAGEVARGCNKDDTHDGKRRCRSWRCAKLGETKGESPNSRIAGAGVMGDEGEPQPRAADMCKEHVDVMNPTHHRDHVVQSFF